jgi:hypothetical protein
MPTLSGWRRRLLFGVVLPALGYLLVHFTLVGRRPPSRSEALGIDPTKLDADTISPHLAQQLGLRSKKPATEVVAVVISAKFCRGNRVAGFHEAVAALPARLRAQVSDRPEVITRVVGVSLDNNPKVGVDYLFRLAEFDEVVAGGNWLNTATEKFLWGSYALKAEIPKVVLLRRTVTWTGGSAAKLEQEQVLQTIDGADKIVAWVAQGAPVGELAPAPAERRTVLLP